MKDVLEEIIAWKRIEVEKYKSEVSEHDIHMQVEKIINLDSPTVSMRKALIESSTGIISEFKRKSPSKGWIKEDGKPDIIPLSYQQYGASAISILTDEKYFGGKDEFILEARKSGVNIPILYKNFIIDEYQIFQARLCGASAILLIAADLKISECKSLLYTAHQLGLEVLLEMHSESELDYAELEPDMYGINNRNLGTFTTDIKNSFYLSSRLPKNVCKVSESGISDPDTVKELKLAGFNGFLIGENFMKTKNPGEALNDFITKIQN
ncbi:MAG: indole-3-glycerol phosphate synthase TrpC [Prevotella sp.]|nr:indole-3-glycerol phosphate synthase TrpC [Prevotella sp.]